MEERPPDVLVHREARVGALVLAVLVPATIAFVALGDPDALVPIVILWALFLVIAAIGVGPVRVTVDREGIRTVGLWPRRIAWRDVDHVAPGTRGTERRVVIVPRQAWRPKLKIPIGRWGPALLAALRGHAPAGVYRVTHADEQTLYGWARAEKIARRAPARVSAARAAAYRESASAGTFLSLDRPLPAEQRHRDQAWIRSGIALGLSAVAWVAEGTARGVVVVATITAVLLAAKTIPHIRWHLRMRGDLRRWMGERARFDARGMLTSEDGTKRLRQLPSDLDDPWMGLHYHLESLEPAGTTLASAPHLGPDLGLPATMREATVRELARVRGVRAEGGKAEIALVVIDHGPDGALLHRFDPRGRALGDTFHEDAAAARAQAELELVLEAWREIDRGADPWSLATLAAQPFSDETAAR